MDVNIFQIFLVNEGERLPHGPLGTFTVGDDAMHGPAPEGVTDGHRDTLSERSGTDEDAVRNVATRVDSVLLQEFLGVPTLVMLKHHIKCQTRVAGAEDDYIVGVLRFVNIVQNRKGCKTAPDV